MNELCQLVDEVGSIEISLDKAQAVGNEISNYYFDLTEEEATPEMLKYYHDHYRVLHNVANDYIFEAHKMIRDIYKAMCEILESDRNKKTAILFNKCSTDVQQNK